ncbi:MULTISPECIES: DUF3592 domain-containing protein [unclassified Leptolyngbya]|uniref:DUF3592 domain-containing protein n=1 Tax=unclassified Leptolyngbya TaxID=2650499 RepID=UPI001686797E|nr:MULTISPECIES: DUF3592 domain-containing protein [unclassified Leptolyngbya]MBD1912254.1 DUF3592 domain-containing protein [Leptolyngbya sp. FACHB-8]MBD2155145.1 DUF3592 domain-containing protein [Leptolyngbya sp. FACHB-16]
MAKKYSVNLENDELISVEVDGITYGSPYEISDSADRAKILAMVESQGAHDNTLEELGIDDDIFDMTMDRPSLETTSSDVDVSIVPKVVGSIFLGVSVLLLSLAAYTGLRTREAIAHEVTTTGKVVDVVTRKDKEGDAFSYPTVTFWLPDDQQHTTELGGGSTQSPYEVGEQVTIAYDPANPDDARIKSVSSTIGLWFLPVHLGFMGTLFGGGTLLALWLIKTDFGNSSKS